MAHVGKIVQNSTARHGLPFMTENSDSCLGTSVIEGWHCTKGRYALAFSAYCVSALSYVSNIKRKIIFFLFKSAMKLMIHHISRLK